MNKMKEVVKLLGYEVGEEFNIILNNGDYSVYNPFKFTDMDLVDSCGDSRMYYLLLLIKGTYKIEKIPFVPKMGEIFWSYGRGIERPYIDRFIWDNTIFHKERKLLGIIFKTEQEALNYLPTWEKRLEGEEI